MFTKFFCAVALLTAALLWSPVLTPATAQEIWLRVGPECCYVFYDGAWIYDYHSWHYHYYQGRNYPYYYRWNGSPRYYQGYYGYQRRENWQRRNNNNGYRQRYRHY